MRPRSVVLKIMDPVGLWVILRNLISRVPKWDPKFGNYPDPVLVSAEFKRSLGTINLKDRSPR